MFWIIIGIVLFFLAMRWIAEDAIKERENEWRKPYIEAGDEFEDY